MRRCPLPLALVALCLLCAPAARAGERALSVLIVASNHSVDAAVPPLQYADDDGARFYELLAPLATRVVLLAQLDDATQRQHPRLAAHSRPPTRAELRLALDQLGAAIRAYRAAGRDTDLLFIYVGHGSVSAEGEGYVHLGDGPYTRTALFQDLVEGSPAHFTHLLLDACHAETMVAGRGEAGAERDQAFATFLDGQALAAHPTVGALVSTSESHESHEWSRIQAGVFSHLLRSALGGAADVNGDGRLEYSEVSAFVDAASAQLPVEHYRTFAWPPAQDRARPLLDLSAGAGRFVVLEPALRGRFLLEDAAGNRWYELNKEAGETLTLFVPATGDFFVRGQGGEARVFPVGPEGVVLLTAADPAPQGRGALARAFETGLFAEPFGPSYYRGYVRAHPNLLEVGPAPGSFLATRAAAPGAVARLRALDGAPPDAMTARAEVQSSWIAAPRGLDLEAGYRVGAYPLLWGPLEHGAYAAAGYDFGHLGAGLTLEGAAAELPDSRARLGSRFSALVEGRASTVLLDLLALRGAIGLGYTWLGLHAPDTLSSEPLAAVGRGRAGLGLKLVEGVWAHLDAGAAAYSLRLGEERVLRWQPFATVGIAWQQEEGSAVVGGMK